MQMNDLQLELDRTKVALMSNKESTFFTTIVFSLKFQWDDSIRTAATNGKYLKWNPQFFLSMPKDERVGVMVHEACHVAYDHMGRLNGRNMRLWNIATDHVINLYLLSRGFKLPSFRLADKRFEDMSAEQVYSILEAEDDQTENQMEDIELPDFVDPNRPTEDEMREHQKHIENVLMRASIQSQMAGCSSGAVPSDIQVFLNKLIKPKLPWTTIIRREVGQMVKSGFTWLRPNRRYFPEHYLPAKWSQKPADMTFYVDISGSVSDRQFNIFVSEIAGALKMFNLKKITIVQFDEVIHHVNIVHNLRELSKIKFSGRMGTDCECIFNHIEETQPKMACIFTDGEFYWYRDKMKARTKILWLINDNEAFTAPFGRVVHHSTKP